MKLEIRLDSDRVRAGETLAGVVEVLEGGTSRSLALTIGFYEESPDYRVLAFGRSGVIHEGDLATGQAVTFAYDVPEWALPSIAGEHGRLSWELEVVSDERGLDTRARRIFDVHG